MNEPTTAAEAIEWLDKNADPTKETMMETKVVTYKNDRLMQSGIKREQQNGWSVLSTGTTDRGRSGLKTVGLGLVFLPLALLGKRKAGFMVTYQRQAGMYPEEKSKSTPKWLRIAGYIALALIVLMVIAVACS